MNIIITGASRGIGYQLVKQLAATNGNTIFAITRNSEALTLLFNELIKGEKTNVILLEYNYTSNCPIAWAQLLGNQKIDICINNAGFLVNKPFGQLSNNDINGMIDVNFLAVANLIQQIIPFANKPCHIVNIGSMGGYQGSSKFAGLSVYSATKAALACLSECLAVELKEQQIACNCLALGAVNTEMLAEAFPGYQAPVSPEEMATFIVKFAMEGHKYFNGKVIPVSLSTP